jgi:hypothetical protein
MTGFAPLKQENLIPLSARENQSDSTYEMTDATHDLTGMGAGDMA